MFLFILDLLAFNVYLVTSAVMCIRTLNHVHLKLIKLMRSACVLFAISMCKTEVALSLPLPSSQLGTSKVPLPILL